MSQNPDHHPDVKGLKLLNDDELAALARALSDERSRRGAIRAGLHVSEVLRFDETLDLIRERTGLGSEDALAMIRAHDPKWSPP